MDICTAETFDYNLISKIKVQHRARGNQGKSAAHRRKYIDLICAFDIETTNLPQFRQNVMYVWQFQVGSICTVMGRSWDEFMLFLTQLLDHIRDPDAGIVIFVHNLSYEFQYLRGVYDFLPDEVFCMDNRKVLKCSMFKGRAEFRCSYLQTNMSLKEFTTKMGVGHVKLDDFEYTETRYPWTPLTDQEIAYCQNDVLGLVEAITAEMEMDGDNLYTIPFTSTGYVRRDAKRAMHKAPHRLVKDMAMDFDLYTALCEAFRGGNCHANRLYSKDIIKDVKSADRSSSYPDVICNKEYPMTPFKKSISPNLCEDTISSLGRLHKAVLCRVKIEGLRLRSDVWPVPYIAAYKCRNLHGPLLDNGRVMEAEELTITITDVDYNIIKEEYEWNSFTVIDLWYSTYGKLPRVFTDVVISYYRAKTELKGDSSQKLYYDKSKAKLNSCYGFMATNPVRIPILFNPKGPDSEEEDFERDPDVNPIEKLEEANNKAFVSYSWGIWVTAWARAELEEGIRLAGPLGFVYTDTDSVKYTGDIDWSEYNARRVAASTASGAYAVDSKGKMHYMGVFEEEEGYTTFCTLGAKKYCGVHTSGKLELTLSGVSKTLGSKELEAAGGLEHFKDGFVFREAGGLCAHYNDYPPQRHVFVDGHDLEITSNIYLDKSEYTLGTAADYDRILKISKIQLERLTHMW